MSILHWQHLASFRPENPWDSDTGIHVLAFEVMGLNRINLVCSSILSGTQRFCRTLIRN